METVVNILGDKSINNDLQHTRNSICKGCTYYKPHIISGTIVLACTKPGYKPKKRDDFKALSCNYYAK